MINHFLQTRNTLRSPDRTAREEDPQRDVMDLAYCPDLMGTRDWFIVFWYCTVFIYHAAAYTFTFVRISSFNIDNGYFRRVCVINKKRCLFWEVNILLLKVTGLDSYQRKKNKSSMYSVCLHLMIKSYQISIFFNWKANIKYLQYQSSITTVI